MVPQCVSRAWKPRTVPVAQFASEPTKQLWLNAGVIGTVQHTEILEIAAAAQTRDFRPMLLIIPAMPILSLLRPVAVRDRASLLSEEYVVESLPRQLFDAVEL